MGHSAYPLHWPDGQPRHNPHQRKNARFDLSLARARDHLLHELKLLGAHYVVISTNMKTRRDGVVRSGAREPDDPGVAVYFDFNNEQHVFACDKWTIVQDNIRAIGKTIEAIRGMGRWGVSEMLKRAVSGFKALPASGDDWRTTLGFDRHEDVTWSQVKVRYLELARGAHPDHGGNQHEMQRLNVAKMTARKELEKQ